MNAAAARRRGRPSVGTIRELVLLGAGVGVVVTALRAHPLDPAALAVGIGLLVGPPAVAAGTKGSPPDDPGGN